MKRVDNSDVNIKLDSRIVYLSNFNAKFYTVNAENFFIRKTQENVISAVLHDMISHNILFLFSLQ